MKLTGAQILMKVLKEEKVDTIFARFNLIVGKVKIDYSPEEISELFGGPMLATLRRRD